MTGWPSRNRASVTRLGIEPTIHPVQGECTQSTELLALAHLLFFFLEICLFNHWKTSETKLLFPLIRGFEPGSPTSRVDFHTTKPLALWSSFFGNFVLFIQSETSQTKQFFSLQEWVLNQDCPHWILTFKRLSHWLFHMCATFFGVLSYCQKRVELFFHLKRGLN